MGLDALAALGFPRAIYVRCAPGGAVALRSNCEPGWIADHEGDMRAGSEPFVRWCLSTYRSIPTGADYLPRYTFLGREDRRVILEARERTGLRAGRSVTIHARSGEAGEAGAASGWHLLTDRPARDVEAHFAEHGTEIALACHMLAARLGSPGSGAALRVASARSALQDGSGPAASGPSGKSLPGSPRRDVPGADAAPTLTPRERECLQFVATGLRVTEIAHRLALSEKTVDLHLANARRRLGARTRDEAVARALIGRAIAL